MEGLVFVFPCFCVWFFRFPGFLYILGCVIVGYAFRGFSEFQCFVSCEFLCDAGFFCWLFEVAFYFEEF